MMNAPHGLQFYNTARQQNKMFCQELDVVFGLRCHIHGKYYVTTHTPWLYADQFLTPVSFVFFVLKTQNSINIDLLTQAWLYAWEGLLIFKITAALLRQSMRLMVKKYTTPTSAPVKAISQDHAMSVRKIMVNNTSDSQGN